MTLMLNALDVILNFQMKTNYLWKLSDKYSQAEKHDHNVFTTFACGGGSSMGYKLAGFTILGANDIDKDMEKVYKENHHPELYYLEDIRKFNERIERKEVDERLFNLDILDGSPPCSTFSMAGSREKSWGKEKKFREGQSKQVLDDLFFHFIRTAELLKPKIVVAENVKGMLLGQSKGYVIEIVKQFNAIGYNVQVFLFNAATMGVPQRRERVFFLCTRKDLNLPKIKLEFNEPAVYLSDLEKVVKNPLGKAMTSKKAEYCWNETTIGKSLSTKHPKGSLFNSVKVSPDKVLPTIAASPGSMLLHYKHPNRLSDEILTLASSFPIDYNFLDISTQYLVGMSVPPLMMARVAEQIYLQWLKK